MMTTRTSDTTDTKQAHKTHSQLGCPTPRVTVRHYATRGHAPPVAPPSTHGAKAQGHKQQQNNTDRRQGVTCETRAGCSASSNLAGRRGTDESTCGVK